MNYWREHIPTTPCFAAESSHGVLQLPDEGVARAWHRSELALVHVACRTWLKAFPHRRRRGRLQQPDRVENREPRDSIRLRASDVDLCAVNGSCPQVGGLDRRQQHHLRHR